MSDLTRQIDELSPEKRELLELLLKKERLSAARRGLRPRRRDGEHSPLSHGQRALWFLQQLEPDNAAYNISTALRILTPPDVPALRRSFQKLVDRHESLRTTFGVIDGEPVQLVQGHTEIYFQEVDASVWDDAELHDFLVREARRPFDLEYGPLFRVSLARRSDSEYVLLMVLHHIVTDLWSQVILTHELGVLYPAEKEGATATLPPPELQYTDYAFWEAEEVTGPAGERMWEYWKKQLAGELPVLNLPTDRPRPPAQTFRGESQTIRLSAKLTDQLKALAQAHGATLYMTLLAAYEMLLYRHTGQEDILVGSPTSGRSRPELAGVVGYFINSIVLRADFSGNPTFAEFLGRVRQTVLGAFEHQDFPFPLLTERLHPVRDSSRPPIFQTTFVIQKSQMPDQRGLTSFVQGETGARMEIGGLVVELMPVFKGTSQFDLRMAVAEAGDELSVLINYNTDLYDAVTITRLLTHFEVLLRSVVADPHQRVSDLPVMTEQELHQILHEWNDTSAPYPQDKSVNELFETQAETRPAAIAAVFEDQRITYGELNARANRLAHHLRSLGVGPESLVGLSVERSLEMLVAMFGILKAGGAYVSLDPAYPKERLDFMLRDAGIRVLVTQQSLLDKLPEHDASVVSLDSDAEAISRHSGQNLPPLADPGNAAYVIYTSGSTGGPKGVVMQHRSTVALIYWAREVFTDDDLTSVFASASINFDCSIFEIFVPLSWGGKIVLGRNALELPSLPAARDITLLNTVPSSMTELLKVGGVPASVRTVNLSADMLPRALVDEVYRQTNAERVYNGYGPTEDTTFTTFGLVERDGDRSPSIGRPITNEQVYLLDRRMNPVPIGLPGELYIGGAGLSRGYLNRPGLITEKFVSNPFSPEPGSRLYKTGDLARWLPDGRIEFVARVDHQVKVRGFRVELKEVEAALEQHPSTRQAVVLAREDAPGVKRLVAYVVAEPPSVPTTSELRSFVRERLPEYMVPSAYVVLDAFPMTPSGKIDRRALPPPEQTRPDLAEDFVAPRNPTEQLLAEIWLQVLGIERVGVYDNFFDLGGDSIMSVHVVSRANQAGLPITTKQLFQHQTISGLAAAVDDRPEGLSGRDGASLSAVTHDNATPVEEVLAVIWSRVLGVKKVAPDDNFFELGGNMESAQAVVAQASEAFETEIPLQALINSPTVAGMAVEVDEILLREVESLSEDEARSSL
jgi:amino acid adenylation domain-containing protein